MGVRWNGQHVGTFGSVGVLSFNGNKIVTAGGGGMLLTDDANLAESARYLTRQAKDHPMEYIHNTVGYNYRLTNLNAALGLAQLQQVDGFLTKKRAMAAIYERNLKDLDGVTFVRPVLGCESSYWLHTVLLPAGTPLETRQAVIGHLDAAGIGARPLWYPINRLPPYAQCLTYEIEHADKLHARAISLPSSVGLTAEDQQRVCDAFRAALAASIG
jgi:perosamine synthetase